jgi:ectoine hydroxylase-related dioxygenase (phytanoyl-CoA dioxygenase family)
MLGRINKKNTEVIESNNVHSIDENESILINSNKSDFDGLTVLKKVFTIGELRKPLHNKDIYKNERFSLFPLMDEYPYHKLLKNIQIKKVVSSLLNTNDFHITTFSSNNLFPNIDKRSYHVDWPYHKYTKDSGNDNLIYPNKLDGVQVLIPLDDFTIENGATMYVPYSHYARRYPTTEILKEGYFTQAEDDDDTEEEKEKKRNKKFACRKRYMLGEVGDVFIYPSTLWHTQGLNTTTTNRRALLINYSPKNIPKKDI